MGSNAPQGREILSLNRDWRFHLGDDLSDEVMIFENMQILNNETSLWQKAGNFGISKPGNPYTKEWRTVDIPHDYALEGEFSRNASVGTGSLPHGKAWYVKRFSLDEADRGRRIALEFDGVYRNCTVYMNGHFVGRHLSGYTSFGYDVTEVCHFGAENGGAENAVAIFVDATDNELWSYEGAGIYRGVRLVKTATVFVPQWGTYVTTGSEDDPGRVNVEVTVRNMGYDSVDCRVINQIISPSGDVVVEMGPLDLSIPGVDEAVASVVTHIDDPELWSVDDPRLYTLQTSVEVDGVEVDSYATPFGVRYYRIDPRPASTSTASP